MLHSNLRRLQHLKTVKEGGAHAGLPTSPCILHHCQTLAVSCLLSSSRLAMLIVNKHCHHFHYCQSHSFYIFMNAKKFVSSYPLIIFPTNMQIFMHILIKRGRICIYLIWSSVKKLQCVFFHWAST